MVVGGGDIPCQGEAGEGCGGGEAEAGLKAVGEGSQCQGSGCEQGTPSVSQGCSQSPRVAGPHHLPLGPSQACHRRDEGKENGQEESQKEGGSGGHQLAALG